MENHKREKGIRAVPSVNVKNILILLLSRVAGVGLSGHGISKVCVCVCAHACVYVCLLISPFCNLQHYLQKCSSEYVL